MTNKEIWELDIDFREYTIEVTHRKLSGEHEGVVQVELKNQRVEGPNYHYWYFDNKKYDHSVSIFFKWLYDHRKQFLLLTWTTSVVYYVQDLFLLKKEWEIDNDNEK